MDVDYDEYADGEALLGWLNARVQLAAPADFDGNAFLANLAMQLRDRLDSQRIEIAHLKMTLAPNEGPDLGSISLTRTETQPQVTHTLKSPLARGSLVINLCAEADPEVLKSDVTAAIRAISAAPADLQVLAAFRPGRPNPTHRMATPTG